MSNTKRTSNKQNLEDKIDMMSRRLEELTIIVGGSASLDKKGLMESQRDDEKFKKEIVQVIKEGNKKLSDNIEQMQKDFDLRFQGLEQWQKKVQSYLNIISSGTFWKVIFGIVIGFASFVVWIKGGWAAASEFFKTAIKLKP